MKVRNLTVKLLKIRSSVKSYMGKLEIATGLMIAALLMSGNATAAAEEEYYTWIDENGITNYAERNPQGYEARYVTADEQRFGYQTGREEEAPEPSLEAPAEDDAEEATTEELNRDVDAEIAAEKQRIDREIAAAKKSNCNIGKLNLAQLTNYNRIKIKDDDGQVRVLSDEEKQSRIDRARATIRENCNG